MGVLGLEGLMPTEVRLGDITPTIIVKNDFPNLEIGVPGVIGIVIMVGEIASAPVLESLAPAGTDILGVRRQKFCPAAVHQGCSRLIRVRPGHAGGPSYPGVVGAVDSLATGVPRRKKVIVPAMLQKGRPLNGAATPGSEGIDCRIGGQLFSRGRVDRDHLDPRPKGPEKHPNIVVGINHHVGVNTVVIIGGTALDD